MFISIVELNFDLLPLSTTSLYMKSRAWRSVRLEAAKPTNNLLFPRLIEPRANQQGKRVQIYQKPR
jgi:hypothetical protein